MFRRVAILTAVVLTLVHAVPANAATQTAGTAQSTLELAHVKLEAPALPGVDLSLGRVSSFASTDSDTVHNALGAGRPFARAALHVPVVGDVEVRSDGMQEHDGQRLALPGGLGALELGNLKADASAEHAESLISALTGDVDAVVAGLAARVPAAGIASKVDTASAAARNGASVEGIAVRLPDLLPLDLLAQLPLDTLLSLVDEIGLDTPLPRELADVANAVRQLVDDLGAVDQVHGAIDESQQQLRELTKQLPKAEASVVALRESITQLEAQLSNAETDAAAIAAQRDEVRAQLAETRDSVAAVSAAGSALHVDAQACSALNSSLCSDVDAVGAQAGSLESQFTQVDQQVAAAESQLDDPNADRAALAAQLRGALDELARAEDLVETIHALVDQIQATLDALIAEINALLDELLELIGGLDIDALRALIEQLLDGLAARELLGIDKVTVGVDTSAAANTSGATALCSVEGVRLLGAVQDVDTCTQLQTVLAQLDTLIEDLLGSLPVVNGIIPAGTVTVRGLTTSTTPANTIEDGYSLADARVHALDVHVRPITLTQAADGLVAEVRALLDGALAQLGDLTGVDTKAVADLEQALAELQNDLASLTAGALEGVQTPELQVRALGAESRATFRAAGNDVAPANVSAAPPVTPSSNLPRTGGSSALALLVFVTGAAGLAWMRSSRRRSAAS